MSQAGIQFGASGWRGVIGDDFTFGRVRGAATAIARAVRAERKRPKLLVACDTRFFSHEFAMAAASVLEAEGVHTLFAGRAMPVPAVSFKILRQKLDGGVYIGAGHDMAEFSGLEFFEADGASAGSERAGEIERLAAKLPVEERDCGEAEGLETIDPSTAYLERLGELVRLEAICRASVELAYDAMHGAGAGWLDRLLVAGGVPVHFLNGDRDVLFDGGVPDPTPANLNRLAKFVNESEAALGMATDGDGGRFGILDERGRFVPPDYVFGLVYDYLVETRDWRLGVARGAAASDLVDAVALHHGLPVYQTQGSFGGFAPLLARDQVAMAVDEDGGLTIRGHVPQSDGILACLLVAEMVAERGPLDVQLKKLIRRVGAGS